MTTTPNELPDDLATAHELIRELAKTVHAQEHLIAKLQHQLEQLLRQRYGRRSEKLDPAQLLLFAREILTAMGTEPAATQPAAGESAAGESAPPEQPAEPASNPIKKNGHGRKPLPASLPRRPVLHDVDPQQLPCPDCGALRTKIGEEVREQLEYVPASLVVLRHVRPKYACKTCQGNVVIAERLPEPIEKGLPGPGLLAQVIVSKYADHLPLYRQERIFARQGVELSRQTTCDWMAVCAELLEPIWRAMHRRILQSQVIQTDDTPVKVQDPITGVMTTGRIWTYLGDYDHRFIVYDYTPDRSSEGPERMLKDFRSGFLQSDAYSAYDQIHARGIVEVGCMAHARRKFDEAKTTDPARAHTGLAWIGRLYQIERQAREQIEEAIERLTKEGPVNAAERALQVQRLAQEITLKLRQEEARPIVEKFATWLETMAGEVLPKSPMGEAIGYARSNWRALTRYLDAGFLAIDNNAAERALRPIAVGRKNWLHLGSDKGGRTAAVLMSLVQSCQAIKIEPFAYLRDVLDRVSTHPASQIADLLPDAWKPTQP
jgi:transposase